MAQPLTSAPPRRRPTPAHALTGGGFVLLCLGLLLVTRVFQYFPGMALVQELGFVLPLLALGPLAAHAASRLPAKNHAFEWYAVAMIVIMPLWSGLAAQQVHGQPPLFGALALRGYAMVAMPLVLLMALRLRWLTLADVDRAFMRCAWGTLALYVVMAALLDPADYADEANAFVENRGDEGMRFKFNNAFLLYAMFSCAVRAVRQRTWQHLGLSLVFFGYMLGSAGGRILTVAVIITAAAVLAWWGSLRSLLKGLAGLGIAIAIAVGLGLLLDAEATQERLDKFGDAFAVVAADADIIDDGSAASRVLQVAIALPFIEEFPLLGSGRISAQWIDGGFKGLMGEHFYPDDIGLIGMVFQFGALGTLAMAWQFVFAWRSAQRWRRTGPGGINRQVTLTCVAYVVYLAVSSVGTGGFVMFPELSMLLIAMLVYASEASKPLTRQTKTSRKRAPRQTARIPSAALTP